MVNNDSSMFISASLAPEIKKWMLTHGPTSISEGYGGDSGC